MSTSILRKAFEATKVTNNIFGKAGRKMIQSSFDTTKKIATLYKDAGYETYRIGKEVVKASLRLAVDNQKELLSTSGEAIKEAAKTIRKTDVKASPKASRKAAPKKRTTRKKSVGRKKKAEVTIDDLI